MISGILRSLLEQFELLNSADWLVFYSLNFFPINSDLVFMMALPGFIVVDGVVPPLNPRPDGEEGPFAFCVLESQLSRLTQTKNAILALKSAGPWTPGQAAAYLELDKQYLKLSQVRCSGTNHCSCLLPWLEGVISQK
jgi:hypothetical protein